MQNQWGQRLTPLMCEPILHFLTPIFEIDGKQYVMMTPQLAGIPKKLLGVSVAGLSAKRDEIISALDFLITEI